MHPATLLFGGIVAGVIAVVGYIIVDNLTSTDQSNTNQKQSYSSQSTSQQKRNESYSRECVICNETGTEEIRTLLCSHRFHDSCLAGYLILKIVEPAKKCPVKSCGRVIPKSIVDIILRPFKQK